MRFSCQKCGKLFQTKNTLALHELGHESELSIGSDEELHTRESGEEDVVVGTGPKGEDLTAVRREVERNPKKKYAVSCTISCYSARILFLVRFHNYLHDSTFVISEVFLL